MNVATEQHSDSDKPKSFIDFPHECLRIFIGLYRAIDSINRINKQTFGSINKQHNIKKINFGGIDGILCKTLLGTTPTLIFSWKINKAHFKCLLFWLPYIAKTLLIQALDEQWKMLNNNKSPISGISGLSGHKFSFRL